MTATSWPLTWRRAGVRLRLPAAAVRALGPLALGALAAAGLALHWRALGAPLWIDEGISIGIASHPLGAIAGVLRQDGSPPLYYVLLHVWMGVFGHGAAATHALSIACVALAVPAGAWAVAAAFGRLAAVLCAALLALSPFVGLYADETRMYALLVLLALLAVGTFLRAFVLGRRRWSAPFGVALAAVMYTHNWGLFFAAAVGAAFALLLAWGPGRRALLVNGAIGFGLAALLYAPWLPTLAFQAAHTGAPWSHVPSGRSLTRALTRMWSGHLPETLALLVGGGGLYEVARRGDPAQRRAIAALGVIAAATLLIAWEWSRLSSPAWALRYLVIVLAPLIALVAIGLGRLPVLGIATVALLFALSWHGHPSDRTLERKSDLQRVVATLGPSVPAHALVVSTQPEQVPLLRYALGPGHGYLTPMGAVADPQVMDWRDALARLRADRGRRLLLSVVRGMGPSGRVLLIQPQFSHPDSPWTSLVRRRARAWGRMLRRRMRVVARVVPDHGYSRSTVDGFVLAPRTVVARIRHGRRHHRG
jgi:mannosyltransferase